jgi:hypothetical protein
MAMDSHRFLLAYCEPVVDGFTGFPSVFLKKKEDGACIFSGEAGCRVYDSRPSCCRYYPLAKAVEKEATGDRRVARYYLQRGAHYCEGIKRGPEWTMEAYFDENGLGPHEKANDVFLEVPFAFERLPLLLRHDREVQTVIYQAVFDFDKFLKTYGSAGSSLITEDDLRLIDRVTDISLNLITRIADLQPKG